MRIPVNKPYREGSKFGQLMWYGKHMGVDYLPAKAGQPDPTISPVSGTVVRASWTPSCGYGIDIKDKDGTTHRLCHHSAILVSQGQKVTEGQQVGKMGNTGLSRGVHVHWAAIKNGQTIDPLSLLTKPIDKEVIKFYFAQVWGREPLEGELLLFYVRVKLNSITTREQLRSTLAYWKGIAAKDPKRWNFEKEKWITKGKKEGAL